MDDFHAAAAAGDERGLEVQADALPAGLGPLVQRGIALFSGRYGAAPAVAGFSPGRINLIGEHTDYNGGLCLPMAIDRWTVVVAGPMDREVAGSGRALREAPLIRVASQGFGAAELGISAPSESGGGRWAQYLAGVIDGLEAAGSPVKSTCLQIVSSIPAGAGLSSSAALEVAGALALSALWGSSPGRVELARLCQRAEQRALGVPCGLLDQLAVLLGRAGQLLPIDFGKGQAGPVPWPDELTVLAVDSGVRHQHAGGEYAARRTECERAARELGVGSLGELPDLPIGTHFGLTPTLARRARHVVGENRRVKQFLACLRSGDWESAGQVLLEGHASLRDDFEVSCQAVDEIVELVRDSGRARGVWGARMTGGGFGGNVVCLARREQAGEAAAWLDEQMAGRQNQANAVQRFDPSGGAGWIRL